MAKQEQDVTVGCLFAAMGGFAEAFEAVGGRVLWANERDRFATVTFTANFPHVRHLLKDVKDVSVAGDELQPVDVLTAGFPCQPFSNAGLKRGFADERGLAFLHIVRLLAEFGRRRPKVLLLENVEHFRTHDEGRTFRRVQAEVQRAGYWFGETDARVLNTAEYTTIPQNRLRLFMVAYSTDQFPRNTFRFPDPVPAAERRSLASFFDADRQSARYYFTPDSRYYLPFVEAMATGRPDAVYQLRRNYVRQNKAGECFTLMANMGLGGHNVPVIKDVWGIRKLTPRECARLQGYDDDFVLPTSLSNAQLGKQIGNSVTVELVQRLAGECVSAVRGTGQRQIMVAKRRAN